MKSSFSRNVTKDIYSVTQSYTNSCLGDVVLDRLTMYLAKDEDNILDQIYLKQTGSNFCYEDLKFWEWLKKMHI